MYRSRLLLPILAFAFLILPACKTGQKTGNILVICDQAAFGNYTPEILKTEGITCFDTISLEKAGELVLNSQDHPAVILSSGSATPALRDKLIGYVTGGGKLISVIPFNDGWENIYTKPSGTASSTPLYLFIDSLSPAGTGLSGHRIRILPGKVRSTVADRAAYGWFGETGSPDRSDPAVINIKRGKGSITLFMYNLPENIVLTRQGNPAAAGLEKDDIPGLRAMDLFTGGWVDTDCSTINQADEQMHLLSQVIEQIALAELPLPKTWYFPDTLKSLVTLTNDGEFRAENDFEIQFRDIDSAGAKMTLYVMETGKVTRSWTEKWTARGFEISGHPDNTREAATPVWSHVDSVMAAKIRDISSLYGLEMKTVVNHWFVWCGTDAGGKQEFSAQAQIEANHGMLLDANYAHYDNNSSSGHFLGSQGKDQGNFTGSGLVMKFAASDGRVIKIWQHLNNVYDQQYNENHDPRGFFEAFKGLMDRSIDNDVWSFISVKSHNDEYYFSKEPLLRMISYAHKRSIPVWTAARLADFLEKREDSVISGLCFDGSDLLFTFGPVGEGQDKLSLVIPFAFGSEKIRTIKVNDTEGSFVKKNLRGKEYAFLKINDPGTHKIKISYR
jgi:hypothetical protein